MLHGFKPNSIKKSLTVSSSNIHYGLCKIGWYFFLLVQAHYQLNIVFLGSRQKCFSCCFDIGRVYQTSHIANSVQNILLMISKNIKIRASKQESKTQLKYQLQFRPRLLLAVHHIYLGGFHLHIFVFPFVYQFHSRIEVLVSSSDTGSVASTARSKLTRSKCE